MSSFIENGVEMETTSEGTGDISLSVSSSTPRTFNDAFATGSANKFRYHIYNKDNSEYEVGIGYLSDSTTLVRDTVIESSNSNNLVDFSTGTKVVTCDNDANQIVDPRDMNDGQVATSNGDNLDLRNLDHVEINNQTPDDHHTEDHASRHSSGGNDTVNLTDLEQSQSDLTNQTGDFVGQLTTHDGTGFLPSGTQCKWNGSNWKVIETSSFSYTGDGTTGRVLADSFQFEEVRVEESGGNVVDSYAGGLSNGAMSTFDFDGELTINSTGGFTVGDNGGDSDPNTNGENYEVYTV